MPFDVVEVRVKSGRTGLPASVRLSKRGGGGSPSCLVSINGAFSSQLKIKEKDRFELMLGSGEHRGLLRLKRKADGIIKPRMCKGSAVSFDLGYIERFGDEAEEKQYVRAQAIDADTFEVVMPAWADPKPRVIPSAPLEDVRARNARLGK